MKLGATVLVVLISFAALTLSTGLHYDSDIDHSKAYTDDRAEVSTGVEASLMRDVDCDGDYETVPRDSTRKCEEDSK